MAALDIPVVVERPAYGDPCTGCGQCCQKSLCSIGERWYGRKDGPCPALEFDGEKYRCGMMANPDKYMPKESVERYGVETLKASAKVLLGAGTGCDTMFRGDVVRRSTYDEVGRRIREHTKAVGPAAVLAAVKHFDIQKLMYEQTMKGNIPEAIIQAVEQYGLDDLIEFMKELFDEGDAAQKL